MKLWSIQTEGAYKKLTDKGELWGDWRRTWDEFRRPYKWLCRQMEERGIALKQRPPMWAWPKKPDLRRNHHLEKGKRGYRLELEVPDELVLVSNFEAWHCVLNDHLLVLSDDDLDLMFDRPRNVMEASWQGIFDKEVCYKGGYNMREQATFPTIKQEYVLRARPFVAR